MRIFGDLIQKSYRAGITIVSPNTLMLTVQTLQTLIRDAQMQKQLGIIKTEVGNILMDIERLNSRVHELQKHFNLASSDIEKIAVSTKKIATSGRKLDVLEHPPDTERLLDKSKD